jgi:hypothetical protein
MNCEVDLLALRRSAPLAVVSLPRRRADRIARLTTQPSRLLFLDCDQEIIYRVVQLKQRKIGLQSKPQLSRRRIKDFIWRNGWFGRSIECDNL